MHQLTRSYAARGLVAVARRSIPATSMTSRQVSNLMRCGLIVDTELACARLDSLFPEWSGVVVPVV